MKLKLGYFGSPDFSSLFLEKILNDSDLKNILEVKLVVTQKDKPAGRKQILTPTPVKQVAEKYQIPIYYQLKSQNSKVLPCRQAGKTKTQNLKLYNLNKIDLCLVYAYSSIIPQDLLNLPKYGFWCLHPSLLPKYRGPSPIAYALINGDKKTGMTIFKMDEKIDHGPIIAQESLTIKIDDYRPDLEKKLTDLGFEMFKKLILTGFNRFQLTAQKDHNATYTRLLTKQDGFITFSTLKKALNNEFLTFDELPEIIKNLKLKIKNSSEAIFNLFRGLYPWPGLWTILPNGKRLKITSMYFNVPRFAPALNRIYSGSGLHVTRSTLYINKVQLEGKKEVDFETFQKAYKLF